MDVSVQIALIVGAGPFVLSCVTAYLQLRHGAKVDQVAKDIKVVEAATNGMKAELVAVTRSDATQIERARGVAEATTINEAVKEHQVERRRQPMIPLVAVPLPAHPQETEIHYVIRNGQLVTLP